MLDIENGDQDQQQRERQLAEHLVGFLRCVRPSVMHADAQQDGDQHQEQILLDEVADGQRDPDALADHGRGQAHDDGNGEQRDHAAQCREGHGERHVASGQFGKDVGGAASRAACDEHEAYEEYRRELERPCETERNQREKDQLSHQGDCDWPGGTEHFSEVFELEGQPQVEHQKGQNRQYNPNSHVQISCELSTKILFFSRTAKEEEQKGREDFHIFAI